MSAGTGVRHGLLELRCGEAAEVLVFDLAPL
jgi:hypothetical protein